MKKILDKLKQLTKTSKNYKIFFISIVIISVIFGTLFSLLINNADKSTVTKYLTNYFTKIIDKNVNFLDLFINSSVSYILIVFLIWVLGISIIGLPINIFIVFAKCFGIGFSIGSIILNYKIKGIIISALYIIPCQLIYMFIFYLLLFYTGNLSIKLLNTLIKKKTLDFKVISNKYLNILLFSFIVIIINALIGAFIDTYLLKSLLSLIK